jgi:hypothetical protein
MQRHTPNDIAEARAIVLEVELDPIQIVVRTPRRNEISPNLVANQSQSLPGVIDPSLVPNLGPVVLDDITPRRGQDVGQNLLNLVDRNPRLDGDNERIYMEPQRRLLRQGNRKTLFQIKLQIICKQVTDPLTLVCVVAKVRVKTRFLAA